MHKKNKYKKNIIRKKLRKKRQELTHLEQNNAAYAITKLILNQKKVLSADHIGLFLSFDGEINTNFLIKNLWKYKKKIYLPFLNFCNQEIMFIKYSSNTLLKKNCFNIYEPLANTKHIIPIKNIDIIFVPLVAFDKKGNRLGMGGGYYDKLLKNLKKNTHPIGLAYDFQLVHKIPIEPWDISLPEIITESKIWKW
ncbi:5-formyltetrahydrofolate cyclo-ligase [Arsenophonus symbiont of Ornithomya chloropus]|uniref:5-formyltetrahydrofolate cyclo-ligase n=1 Tax=Arsenophonus symbiont of Ornithomya chloropus TaxID=634121 RepID=UPI0032B12DE3